MSMDWEEYLKFMDSWDGRVIDPKGFVQLEYATPVTPKEYLEFADKDLLVNGNHGLVNSLSNAKRAIDCQITNLLSVLGLKTSGNIHTKIQRIEDIGILAPRIIKKVNKIRNLLEHEFYKPTNDEAEDAVDIATLFVEATDKVFREFMDSWWVAKDGSANSGHVVTEGNKTIIYNDDLPCITFSDGLYIQYDQESCDYGLWGYYENKQVLEAEIKKGSELHIELLKYSILNDHSVVDFDEEGVAIKFIERVRGKVGISL